MNRITIFISASLCLLIRMDVSLFCAKKKRTCKVWNTGSDTNTTTNSWLLTANLGCAKPNHLMILGPSGLALQCPKLRWHNFLLLTPVNTVLSHHAPAVPMKVKPVSHALQLCFSPSDSQLSWFCSQRKDAISHQSLVSSLMGSSWCNDTAGFDTLVVDEEGGSEGRQCSTEGLLLWKVLNKRATSFADSFHSIIVPDRGVFQPEKWWKPHQRQPWHGMAQHEFCLMCWELTSPCISKGKLDKRIALAEIQSWHFYHRHP